MKYHTERRDLKNARHYICLYKLYPGLIWLFYHWIPVVCFRSPLRTQFPQTPLGVAVYFPPHCFCETARSRTKPRDLQIPFLFQLASKMVGTVAYLCVQKWMEIWGHPCPLKLLTVTRTRLRINTPLVFISGVLFWRLIQFLYWWVMWTRLPRAHDSPSAYSPGCV